MRPKDLPTLFQWETRRPLYEKGILSVPRHFNKHEEYSIPELTSSEIFPNSAPIYVEFCSGNGEWIIDKARQNPDINWIAVEKQFKRIRKIWSKKENHRLENLLIVCGMAEDFSQFYLPDGKIQKAFVNFPDPWPKKRHHKHRLIQPPFVDMLSRIIKPEGDITVVTDDAPYAEQVVDVLGNHKEFSPMFPYPHYQTDWDEYGSSYFNRLWRDLGRTIRFIQYQKKKPKEAVSAGR